MRSRREITAKLSQMLNRQRSERKRKFLSRSPSNCVHNERVRIHGNGTVGICADPEVSAGLKSGIFVCETQEACDNCQRFFCKHTEESVIEDFDNILKDPSTCGQEYPKIAMLLWALNGEMPKTESRFKTFFKALYRKLLRRQNEG